MAKSAGGRMLSKDISVSDNFSHLSPHSQLLFLMLIPHFNARGKMHGSPYIVKGRIVPKLDNFTPDNIRTSLKEISEKTNVKFYTIKGVEYLQSLSWEEHQTLHKDRLGKDDIPDYVPDLSGTTPGVVTDIPSTSTSTSTSNFKEEKERKISKKRTVEKEVFGFQEFWDAYPKKTGKGAAEGSFLKILMTPDLLTQILVAINNAKKTDQWKKDNGQFIPMPSTWLNQRRWEDEYLPATGMSSKTNQTVENMKRFIEGK